MVKAKVAILLKNKFKFSLILIGAFVGLIILAFAIFCLYYSDKIYPNTFIGPLSLAGLTKEEAKQILKDNFAKESAQVITLNLDDKSWQLNPQDLNLTYDLDKTADALYAIGRRPSFLESIKEQFLSIFLDHQLAAVYNLQAKTLTDFLNKISQEVDMPAKDASIVFKTESLAILSEADGKKYDREGVEQQIAQIFGTLLPQNKIGLTVAVDKPKIYKKDIQAAWPQIQNFIDKTIILKSDDHNYTVSAADIAKWIKLSPSKAIESSQNEAVSAQAVKSISLITIGVDPAKIKGYIESLAQDIHLEAVDAKLRVTDGKVGVFQPSQDGLVLDKDKTLSLLSEAVSGSAKKTTINLPTKVLKPKITLTSINNLGIEELMGEGTSSFKGSPSNRIHNITVGANLFEGVLIAPGEVFSFLKILGEVSASRGFLPELVIKEDRLVPETGGGLCQVSTTMFRAAIYAGLEIVERTAHAFRVRYYEPPVGMDATIYDPAPDLKFKNDTADYILIHTKLEGTNLTFQFFGTKDGRNVEVQGPSIYDYRSPGEPVYIDDPSLPAGEVRQVERAVAGATASFNWTVTKNGQILHKKTFVSKYVPWRAKFKRGTGPVAEPVPAENPPADQQPAPAQPAPVEQPAPTN